MIVLFLLGAYFSYVIVKPFIIPIFNAAIIAYLFYPVYRFINNRLRKKNLSAVLVCLFVFLTVVIPFIFIISSLYVQLPRFYAWILNIMQNSGVVFGFFEKIYHNPAGFDLNSIFQPILSGFIAYLRDTLTSIPSKIGSIVFSAMFLFFLLRDGDELVRVLRSHLPFSKKITDCLFNEFKITTDGILYGQLVTAVVQAVLATIGYSLLGIEAPVVWGILTLFFAIIPMFGPAIVYMPLCVSLFASYFDTGSQVFLIKGIVLLGYGVLVISMVDNFLKPLFISGKAKVHPMLVMVGVFGGVGVFGLSGLVLGPLILVMFITLFKIYSSTL